MTRSPRPGRNRGGARHQPPRVRFRFGRSPACDPPAPRPVRGAEPFRIGVLMGGPSRERRVSFASGEAVAAALEERGHRVDWLVVGDDTSDLPWLEGSACDAFFLALHGTFGENGEIQRRLDAVGIPYTGSGADASALAFDKVRAKEALRAAGIPTPDWRRIPTPDAGAEPGQVEALLEPLGLPLVLKPIAEGSSIGVRIVGEREALAPALESLAALETPLMAEAFAPGRELTVGILGDCPLPVVEIVPGRDFYDYEAKYDPRSGTRYVVDPPDLPPGVAKRARRLALEVHQALGCRGENRVDLRLAPDGTLTCLEANTIPGFTRTSLLPKAAEAAGLSLGELCEAMVRRAVGARRTARAARRRPAHERARS